MAAESHYPAAIVRHYGVWEGSAVHLSPEGEILDRHATKLEIGAKGGRYSQRNTYTWPDGSQRVFDFPGRFDDTRKLLSIESERLQGEGTVLGENVVLFKASYKGQGDLGDVSVHDLIRMCGDGKSRCRTWQMFKMDKPWKIVNVVERQTSAENAYIEMGSA